MGQGEPGGRHQGGVEPFCSRPDIPYFPLREPHLRIRCGSQHRMIGCRLKPWVKSGRRLACDRCPLSATSRHLINSISEGSTITRSVHTSCSAIDRRAA